jgi:hypothetical protein
MAGHSEKNEVDVKFEKSVFPSAPRSPSSPCTWAVLQSLDELHAPAMQLCGEQLYLKQLPRFASPFSHALERLLRSAPFRRAHLRRYVGSLSSCESLPHASSRRRSYRRVATRTIHETMEMLIPSVYGLYCSASKRRRIRYAVKNGDASTRIRSHTCDSRERSVCVFPR